MLRTRSLAGREILAHLASGGTLDLDQLVELSTDDPLPGSGVRSAGTVDSIDPHWVSQLARVLALQAIEEDDLTNAVSLFKWLEDRDGVASFDSTMAKIYAESLLESGDRLGLSRRLRALELSDTDRLMLVTDLLNPFMANGVGEAKDRWLNSFARCMGFEDAAAGGIALLDTPDLSPFDRLNGLPLSRDRGWPDGDGDRHRLLS